MKDDNRALVERMLRAFEAKDAQRAASCFTEDGLFIDPHYPEPAIQGRAAIQQGFGFAFGMLEQPGFTIRNFWSNETSGATEVDTDHIMADGSEVQFPQVFVFETKDGLLSRFQAYVPYPPPSPGINAADPAH